MIKNYIKKLFFLLLICGTFVPAFAQNDSDIIAKFMDSLAIIDKTIPYQKGVVSINEGIELNIPENYKFIPKDKAKMIVHDLWQNPENESILGMLVQDDFSLNKLEAWAFIVSYDESGYVKDEDAQKIDYNELLKSIQEDEAEENKQRNEMGYESIHLLDWAVTPFYDHERKILHWAKKYQFGDATTAPDDLTLNYDVRILGRKGVLSLNAVGTMQQLEDINAHISDVLAIANFKNGYAYRDFDPSIDDVAAYTIGGLVAGKVLAKTGLFVLLLKNIKLVIFGIVAFFGAFRKKIIGLFRKKKDDEHLDNSDSMSEDNSNIEMNAKEELIVTDATSSTTSNE